MSTIWETLPRPIITLAPMADVTDSAFRQIIAGCGSPDLFFTEFVSADGLCSDKGRAKLLRELYFTPSEQPIIAQLFSAKPEKMLEAAKLVAGLGFAGIDINMGCPDRTIEKQGAGAALIKNHSLAQEVIAAAKEGAGSLPVSVKTRLGYNQLEFESWGAKLLEAKPAAITWHLRTRKEMSKVAAHWELAREVVALAKDTSVLTLANGDVKTVAEAKQKAAEYGLDGVMLGRAIYGNPWLFAEKEVTPKERLNKLQEHVELFEKLYRPGPINDQLFGGHTKNFAVMRKFFGAYVKDLPNAARVREALMAAETAAQVSAILKSAHV